MMLLSNSSMVGHHAGSCVRTSQKVLACLSGSIYAPELSASESVGNVGQLAVDLIIATLRLPLVGYLESQHLLPCAGVDAFGQDGSVHLALDVMADADRQLVIVQQRSPAVNGCQGLFAAALSTWIKDAGFSEVAYCGSIDSRLRQNAQQFVGTQVRVISGRCPGTLSALQLKELEPGLEESLGSRKLLPPWQLLKETNDRGVPMFAVVRFATEGDNVGDARDLCDALLPWLPCDSSGAVETEDWQIPRSWDCAYGQDRTALAY